MYIGETGRTLHRRLNDLRMELRNPDLMPWSDLHAEAPALWAWSDWSSGQEDEKDSQDPPGLPTGRYEYECSAAPLDTSVNGRKGMKSFLLSQYRQVRGRSTFCNFGRFHPRYRKSTNRKGGLRGGRLAEGQKDNPAGFPSMESLEVSGKPGESTWMGLEWTAWETLVPENAREVAAFAGVYLIADAGSHEIVYIGQSADVTERLLDHCGRTGIERSLAFSYQIVGQSVLPHNLRELETDLIGNFFENFREGAGVPVPERAGKNQ